MTGRTEKMRVLAAYASRRGATQAIAGRIAETLAATGRAGAVRPVQAAGEPAGYDAFVIGSAVYCGSWLKEAAAFVRRNRAIPATRPVWLISSGPLGAEATDDQGRDLRAVAEPKEFTEFEETITPRGQRVFFGVLNPASSDSRSDWSGAGLPGARCCRRATSVTGERSRPGRSASRAN